MYLPLSRAIIIIATKVGPTMPRMGGAAPTLPLKHQGQTAPRLLRPSRHRQTAHRYLVQWAVKVGRGGSVCRRVARGSVWCGLRHYPQCCSAPEPSTMATRLVTKRMALTRPGMLNVRE